MKCERKVKNENKIKSLDKMGIYRVFGQLEVSFLFIFILSM